MSTRLDRLIELLHTGSNAAVRTTAAQQIGEIAKIRPADVNLLLEKILPQLRNTNWDTRIAAGKAIECIVSNLPKWDPLQNGTLVISKMKNADEHVKNAGGYDRFDVEDVLKRGYPLLSSSGSGLEADETASSRERLQRRRMSKMKQRKGSQTSQKLSTAGEMVESEAPFLDALTSSL